MTCDLFELAKVVAEQKDAVLEVIKFIATNFREPEKIVAEMRKKDVFQPYDFNFDPERWNPWRARRFIHFVCGDLEISKPVEARPLYVAVALGPCASAYGRAEMEADDFINICHELVGSNAGKQDWKEITDFFDDKCPPLATAVRFHREFNKMKPYKTRCNEPYNDRFHDLPHRDGVIIDTPGAVTEFSRCLRDCEHFSADFHGTSCFEDDRGRLSLATFVFKRGIFHVIPALFHSI